MPGFPSKHLIDSSGLFQSLADFVKKLESIFTQLESSKVPAFMNNICGSSLA